MSFLDRILPGRKPIDRVDLSDAEEKLQKELRDLNDLHRRAEEIERSRWFVDTVFPRKEGVKTNGRA